MKKQSLYILLVCTLLLLTNRLNGQNLVPNPGFETFNNCPAGNSGISNGLVPSWSNCPGSITTPDYFHTCATAGNNCGNVNVPNNFAGNAPALSGNAYAGVLTYYQGCTNCREYIMAQLTAPLVSGQTYSIGMYIRLGSKSEFATNGMGMHLTNLPLNQPGNQPIILTPTIEQTAVINNPNNWVLVSGNYVAAGGERYVTIGNFRNNANTTVNTVSFGGSNCALATIGCNFYVDDVFVIPVTALTIHGDTVICAGDTDTLIAAGSTSGYTWENLANPGVIIGTGDTLLVQPAVTTTYLVYNASDSATFTVQVNFVPTVSLGNDTTLCGGQITLDATTPNATYLWNNNTTQPTLTVNASGVYWAEVTVNGCRTRDSITVTYITPPVVNLGNDTSLCSGNTLVLDVTTPNSSYLWSTGSTQSSIIVTSTGQYWAEVNTGGCIHRDSILVNVITAGSVNLGNDTVICHAGPVILNATTPNASYQWSTGSTQSTISVNTSGTYWVNVNVSGCTASDTISLVFISVIPPDLGTDTTICQGNTLLLDATVPGATGYLWSNGNNTAQINITTGGSYWVTVTSGPCSSSDTIAVNFVPVPPAQFLTDTTVCTGTVVTLQAPAGYSAYLWNTGATTSFINITSTGTYWAVIGTGGCISADTAVVNYLNVPSIDLGPPREICEDSSVILQPLLTEANTTYTWSNNATGPQITVSETGTYILTAANICGTANDTVHVGRRNCLCYLYLPNTFTPNLDGKNEEFRPGYDCDIRNYELLIFNRWGELIFRSAHPDFGWRGNINDDTEAPNGIYVYYLRYENINLPEGFREIRGLIHLLR